MHSVLFSSAILWLAKPGLNQFYAGKVVESWHNFIFMENKNNQTKRNLNIDVVYIAYDKIWYLKCSTFI